MPAKIELTLNGGPPREFWIEKRVIRVGSDPQCDIPIPDKSGPGHLATIQFRDGRYVVRNRAGRNLQIADRLIGPEDSDIWSSAEEIPLSGATLTLHIDGDPTPVPRQDHRQITDQYLRARDEEQLAVVVPPEESGDDGGTDIAGDLAPNATRSASLQTLVGVVCLLMSASIIIGMLLLFFADSEVPAKEVSPATFVPSLLKVEYAEQLPASLVVRMQEAQQGINLKDREVSLRRLQRLEGELERLALAGKSLTIEAEGKAVECEPLIRAYINYYMSQLKDDES